MTTKDSYFMHVVYKNNSFSFKKNSGVQLHVVIRASLLDIQIAPVSPLFAPAPQYSSIFFLISQVQICVRMIRSSPYIKPVSCHKTSFSHVKHS